MNIIEYFNTSMQKNLCIKIKVWRRLLRGKNVLPGKETFLASKKIDVAKMLTEEMEFFEELRCNRAT